MPDKSPKPNDPVDAAYHEITERCLAAYDEVALLRRLVLSMVLNIDIEFMPTDEAAKLREIMGEP